MERLSRRRRKTQKEVLWTWSSRQNTSLEAKDLTGIKRSVRAAKVAQWVRICLPTQETQEAWVRFLGREDLLEEEMATRPTTLAWKIPWTEGAWWATVMGSQKNWTGLRAEHTHTHKQSVPDDST